MIKIRMYIPADYPAITAIRNSIFAEPMTEEQLRDNDARNDAAGVLWTRFVAEDEAGEVVGYAVSGHYSWLPANHYLLGVGVRKDRRGQGIGTSLLAAAEGWAKAHGALGEFTAMLRGGDEASFAWAVSKGYYLDLQRTESVLDLANWDGSRFAGHLDKVRGGGITLGMMPLSDVSEDVLRQMYEVEATTAPDVPDYEGHMPTWEEWRQDLLGEPAPQVCAIAMDGGRVIGQSLLRLPLAPGAGAYTGYTGVLREYRGRGIALAVKLLTIEAAVGAGAPHMRTNNDEENPAMLAVNAKLGYRMVPGPRRMKKKL